MKRAAFMILLCFTTAPARAECVLVPSAACDGGACPASFPQGGMIYNRDYEVIQLCLADGSWKAMGTLAAGPPSGCPAIGNICNDGTVYAGPSPDGGRPMYTTPADRPALAPWNDGSSNYTTTGVMDENTGAANTLSLIQADSNSVVPGRQLHIAAQTCSDLNIYGRSDWYLPAKNELNVLFANRMAIGGFENGYHASSTETAPAQAYTQRFSDGWDQSRSKREERHIRCVRK